MKRTVLCMIRVAQQRRSSVQACSGSFSLLLVLCLLLSACSQTTPSAPVATPAASAASTTLPPTNTVQPSAILPPTNTVQPSPIPSPTVQATVVTAPPAAVEYNLGDSTIVQESFPEGDRMRNMPVRLNGVIAAPTAAGRHPVVVIIHGNHPGCSTSTWPCDQKDEQPNYRGFGYLTSALAARGYIALSMNANAEYTEDFGSSPPSIRTGLLLQQHLKALAQANQGEKQAFGVDLKDRVDLSKLVLIGHSQGGEFSNRIIFKNKLTTPEGAAAFGFGPVYGLIQIAPPILVEDSDMMSDIPLAVIAPLCDGDVGTLEGHAYYEVARSQVERKSFAQVVTIDHAVHNLFNSVLSNERGEAQPDRPDCQTYLDGNAQQQFMAQYAPDFLDTIFGTAEQKQAAARRLGWDAKQPVPTKLYDLPMHMSVSAPRAQRLTLMQPRSKDELSQNLAGGSVTLDRIEGIYCKPWYQAAGSPDYVEACRRTNFNQPGYPEQMSISWKERGAALRSTLPTDKQNLQAYPALSLRAVQDRASTLNPEGKAQSFSIVLTDTSGKTATVIIPPSDLTMQYPLGILDPEQDKLKGSVYTGHTILSTLRVPLSDFKGVDLSAIKEVALVFDQSDSGTLFLSDLEFVKEPRFEP